MVVHGWAGAPHHDGGLGDHGDCHQSGSEHNTHGQTKGGGGKEERERERERKSRLKSINANPKFLHYFQPLRVQDF